MAEAQVTGQPVAGSVSCLNSGTSKEDPVGVRVLLLKVSKHLGHIRSLF